MPQPNVPLILTELEARALAELCGNTLDYDDQARALFPSAPSRAAAYRAAGKVHHALGELLRAHATAEAAR